MNTMRRLFREGPWEARPDSLAQFKTKGRWTPTRHLSWLVDRILPGISRGGYNAIINLPPRHGKSELSSHHLPAWFLHWWPERDVIVTSYEGGLAADFGRKVRDAVGERNIRQDSRAVQRWMTVAGGGMATAGVGGPITGRGGELIVCDDPHKNWQEATSPKALDTIRNWWNTTLWTRREPRACVLVVMTRWCDQDMTAWLLREYPETFDHIVLPALALEGDPLGRAPGEALWPERYPVEELENIRHQIGSFVFEAMFQQQPMAAGGNVWNSNWWKHWTGFASSDESSWTPDLVPHEAYSSWFQSWDMTFKATESGSFVVGETWAAKRPYLYLVDQIRARMSFVQTIGAVRTLTARWPAARLKLVEDRANGPAVMSQLQNELGGFEPVEPYGSKMARALAASPALEAGYVRIPSPQQYEWVPGFIKECSRFPNGEHDDQVDTASQAILHGTKYTGQLFVGVL